jgi:4'-phosphopantetheinyl transferase
MMPPSDTISLQRPNLPGGHVELWYTYLDRIANPSQLHQYYELLNAMERDRLARFRLERVRKEYLIARALVRCVLSHYADVPPQRWNFIAENQGKPVVASPWEGYGAFNLSHSSGLVICAVAAGGHVGADVESLDRTITGIPLARRFFSRQEVDLLCQAPEDQWQELFLQIWTLKESYIKAIGHGLSMPLDRFFFTLPDDGPPELYLTDQAASPQVGWQFAQLRLPSRHHISVALSLEDQDSDMVVHAREIIPLEGVLSGDPVICSSANNWYFVND